MIDEKRLAQMMAEQYNEYWNRADIFEDIETQMAMRVMLTIHNMIDSLAKADVTDTKVGCKWIPCSERLPEEFKNVLATNATGFICIAKRSGESWYEDAGFGRVYIDAWMPLPTPYREDGRSDGKN